MDPKVVEAMMPYLQKSMVTHSKKPYILDGMLKGTVENSRKQVADLIGYQI